VPPPPPNYAPSLLVRQLTTRFVADLQPLLQLRVTPVVAEVVYQTVLRRAQVGLDPFLKALILAVIQLLNDPSEKKYLKRLLVKVFKRDGIRDKVIAW